MDSINESIVQVDKLYNIFNKLNVSKYNKNIDEINIKLYKLYLLYYEKYNLPFNELNISEKDKNIYIKKRTYLINKLMTLKKKIMYLKENNYPWPWTDLDVVDMSIGFINKKSMELFELKYINEYSVKLFYCN